MNTQIEIEPESYDDSLEIEEEGEEAIELTAGQLALVLGLPLKWFQT